MALQRGDGTTEGRWRHRGPMAPQRADGATGGWRPQRADGATWRWRHTGPMASQEASQEDGATEGRWRNMAMAPQRDDGCSERIAADQLSSFYPVLTMPCS
jgi:hypothetical protein